MRILAFFTMCVLCVTGLFVSPAHAEYACQTLQQPVQSAIAEQQLIITQLETYISALRAHIEEIEQNPSFSEDDLFRFLKTHAYMLNQILMQKSLNASIRVRVDIDNKRLVLAEDATIKKENQKKEENVSFRNLLSQEELDALLSISDKNIESKREFNVSSIIDFLLGISITVSITGAAFLFSLSATNPFIAFGRAAILVIGGGCLLFFLWRANIISAPAFIKRFIPFLLMFIVLINPSLVQASRVLNPTDDTGKGTPVYVVSEAEVFRRQLTDPDPTIRANAAYELLDHINAQTVDALIPLLNDPSWQVVIAALHTLGHSHEVLLIDTIKRSMQHKRWQPDFMEVVRVAHLMALGNIFDESVIPFIGEQLRRDDSENVKSMCVQILRKFKTKEALMELKKFLKEPGSASRELIEDVEFIVDALEIYIKVKEKHSAGTTIKHLFVLAATSMVFLSPSITHATETLLETALQEGSFALSFFAVFTIMGGIISLFILGRATVVKRVKIILQQMYVYAKKLFIRIGQFAEEKHVLFLSVVTAVFSLLGAQYIYAAPAHIATEEICVSFSLHAAIVAALCSSLLVLRMHDKQEEMVRDFVRANIRRAKQGDHLFLAEFFSEIEEYSEKWRMSLIEELARVAGKSSVEDCKVILFLLNAFNEKEATYYVRDFLTHTSFKVREMAYYLLATSDELTFKDMTTKVGCDIVDMDVASRLEKAERVIRKYLRKRKSNRLMNVSVVEPNTYSFSKKEQDYIASTGMVAWLYLLPEYRPEQEDQYKQEVSDFLFVLSCYAISRDRDNPQKITAHESFAELLPVYALLLESPVAEVRELTGLFLQDSNLFTSELVVIRSIYDFLDEDKTVRQRAREYLEELRTYELGDPREKEKIKALLEFRKKNAHMKNERKTVVRIEGILGLLPQSQNGKVISLFAKSFIFFLVFSSYFIVPESIYAATNSSLLESMFSFHDVLVLSLAMLAGLSVLGSGGNDGTDGTWENDLDVKLYDIIKLIATKDPSLKKEGEEALRELLAEEDINEVQDLIQTYWGHPEKKIVRAALGPALAIVHAVRIQQEKKTLRMYDEAVVKRVEAIIEEAVHGKAHMNPKAAKMLHDLLLDKDVYAGDVVDLLLRALNSDDLKRRETANVALKMATAFMRNQVSGHEKQEQIEHSIHKHRQRALVDAQVVSAMTEEEVFQRLFSILRYIAETRGRFPAEYDEMFKQFRISKKGDFGKIKNALDRMWEVAKREKSALLRQALIRLQRIIENAEDKFSNTHSTDTKLQSILIPFLLALTLMSIPFPVHAANESSLETFMTILPYILVLLIIVTVPIVIKWFREALQEVQKKNELHRKKITREIVELIKMLHDPKKEHRNHAIRSFRYVLKEHYGREFLKDYLHDHESIPVVVTLILYCGVADDELVGYAEDILRTVEHLPVSIFDDLVHYLNEGDPLQRIIAIRMLYVLKRPHAVLPVLNSRLEKEGHENVRAELLEVISLMRAENNLDINTYALPVISKEEFETSRDIREQYIMETLFDLEKSKTLERFATMLFDSTHPFVRYMKFDPKTITWRITTNGILGGSDSEKRIVGIHEKMLAEPEIMRFILEHEVAHILYDELIKKGLMHDGFMTKEVMLNWLLAKQLMAHAAHRELSDGKGEAKKFFTKIKTFLRAHSRTHDTYALTLKTIINFLRVGGFRTFELEEMETYARFLYPEEWDSVNYDSKFFYYFDDVIEHYSVSMRELIRVNLNMAYATIATQWWRSRYMEKAIVLCNPRSISADVILFLKANPQTKLFVYSDKREQTEILLKGLYPHSNVIFITDRDVLLDDFIRYLIRENGPDNVRVITQTIQEADTIDVSGIPFFVTEKNDKAVELFVPLACSFDEKDLRALAGRDSFIQRTGRLFRINQEYFHRLWEMKVFNLPQVELLDTIVANLYNVLRNHQKQQIIRQAA